MATWTAVLVLAVAVSIMAAMGRARERARIRRIEAALLGGGPSSVAGPVDFASFPELPAPVARYFRYALSDGQACVRTARFRQSGALKTRTGAETWMAFTADQLVVPSLPGFLWDARVSIPPGLPMRILDSSLAGVGGGSVSLLSTFSIASQTNSPELNSAALLRYLAEAVWSPTALLPCYGVTWRAIDERAALASLTVGGVTVSLEFRFNEAGEIIGVYSPGRYRRRRGGYELTPWEGRFTNYQVRAGMRVPLYGEVGWYDNGELELIWKGTVDDAEYEFERESDKSEGRVG